MVKQDLHQNLNGGSNPTSPLKVCEIDKLQAVKLIDSFHYSKIMPRHTKHYLGIFENYNLIGVITLGWGTQPLQTIRKIFPDSGFTTKNYYEIGKMCFLPEKNKSKSFGSMILAAAIKYIKRNIPIDILYTLADGIMGKCGYVYQAANFKFIGSFETSVYWDKKTGEKIHPRAAKELLHENSILSGKKMFWLSHAFCEQKGIEKITGKMFRYVYPLTKIGERELAKMNVLKNPKNNDLIFKRRTSHGNEIITQPKFNMNIYSNSSQNEKINLRTAQEVLF